MKNLTRKVLAAIKNYNMVSEGDELAVCLSGGKDSLLLLYVLNEIRERCGMDYSLKALTLDMCFENRCTDFSQIKFFCNTLKVSHYVKAVPLWDLIFVKRKEKNPCSLCSRMRKGILNDFAVSLGCNKVALGHNFDDVIETFLLNLFYNGNLNCFSPVTYLSRKKVTTIRPLVFCKESQIVTCVRDLKLPVVKKMCPSDGNTRREDVKQMLKTIENSLCPNIKDRIFQALVKSKIAKW